ncbi:spore germination protein [Paenibacillus curdlanolyticus YK9]|uniref:Spore germination protein n=2 Tax=Paenibacillus curdlanolyticus TaxID=59840 RepID=E0I5T0_9BACL|nr:spore germination protein [Paenibacillus curdlanolyticus YK9]
MGLERIGIRQLSILVIHFMLGTSILIAPSNLAHVARQDGWMAACIGIGFVIGSVWLYARLARRYPSMTFTMMIEHVLGKWVGKIISFMLFTYLFLLTSFLVRVAGNFITTQMMPETPIESIHFILIITIVIAVCYGIETIARASEILFLPVTALLVLLLVFLMPEIHFANLMPVLERGPKPVALSSFYMFTIHEVAVFLMIYPYVSKPNKIRSAMVTGVVVGGAAIIFTTLLCLLVMGPNLTERNIFASYSLAKKITVAHFLRIDAVMAIIWLVALFFKSTITFYGAVLSLSQTLQLPRYRVLAMPLGFLLLWLSIIVYSNIVEFLNFTPGVWSLYSCCYVIILPLLLLIVGRIRFGKFQQAVPPPSGPQQQKQANNEQAG